MGPGTSRRLDADRGPDPAPGQRDRLGRLRERAFGRVLEAADAAVFDDLDTAGVGYDSIILHGVLGTATDPGRLIERMVDVLAAPDGQVLFLEPTAGSSGRGGPVDVPRELRDRGLFVTDLDRFELDGGPRSARVWVEGVARRNRHVQPT